MLRKIFAFAVVACALVVADLAQAAQVRITMVKDPTAIGCTGCTLSGAGTYQIVAEVLDSGDNFGLAGYSIPVLGIDTLLHRGPRVNLSTTADEETSGPAGFSNFRVPNNTQNGIGGASFNFGASQDYFTPTPFLIRGYGQESSSFATKLPGNTNVGTVQPSWNAALVLAEGTYLAGASPSVDGGSIDFSANLFSAATGGNVLAGVMSTRLSCGTLGGACDIPPGEVPIVTDFTHATTLLNEVVATTLTATNNPTSWSNLLNPTFTPMFGSEDNGPVPGAFFNPVWNPATQQFSWNTKGSSRGRYTWTVDATNAAGTSTGEGRGLITIDVTQVPEPATISMFGLALVGFVGLARRRG